MKLLPTLIALAVSGFANAQHHLPAAATSNINGGINSPTSSNVDIEGVATISDEADDTAARKLKLHDVLTSVKDIMEEEFGLDLTTTDGSGRRLSKSHKSDKGIDIIDKVFLLIVLLLVEFLGLGGGYDTSMLDGLLGAGEEDDTAGEITAAHHGHDGSSSKTAKSEGTDASAKATKESKSSKSAEMDDDGSTDDDEPCDDGPASDRRLKENIKQVGRSPSGISIYTFKYRDDMADFLGDNVDTNSVYFGVMAQELLDIAPEAVVTNPTTGYYAVDYSKIDVDFRKVD